MPESAVTQQVAPGAQTSPRRSGLGASAESDFDRIVLPLKYDPLDRAPHQPLPIHWATNLCLALGIRLDGFALLDRRLGTFRGDTGEHWRCWMPGAVSPDERSVGKDGHAFLRALMKHAPPDSWALDPNYGSIRFHERISLASVLRAASGTLDCVATIRSDSKWPALFIRRTLRNLPPGIESKTGTTPAPLIPLFFNDALTLDGDELSAQAIEAARLPSNSTIQALMPIGERYTFHGIAGRTLRTTSSILLLRGLKGSECRYATAFPKTKAVEYLMLYPNPLLRGLIGLYSKSLSGPADLAFSVQ